MKLFKGRHIETPERRRVERAVRSELEEASGAFRRGRTLTGSASPFVHTPNEGRADLKSSRVHTHTLTKQRRRLMGLLLATLTIVAVLYVLVSQFTARAVVYASPDTSLQLDSLYARAIDDYLNDHISERWRFLTADDRLTQAVQVVAPEVKSVRVRGGAEFGKSSFEIVFREPIASWNIDNRELYVDAEGIPFSRNYFALPQLRITDQSGMTTAGAGRSVMSNRFMGYIGQVLSLAGQQGYEVEAVVIPQGMTRQISLTVKGVGYPIQFSSDRPAGEGVDDMVKTIQWMKARQYTPEYIDVRVSGRVFYR